MKKSSQNQAFFESYSKNHSLVGSLRLFLSCWVRMNRSELVAIISFVLDTIALTCGLGLLFAILLIGGAR